MKMMTWMRFILTRHNMSLFRPTSEFFSSAAPAEAEVRRTSEILGEAILSSVTSVRDSLPEQHRAHFETLRQ